MSSFESSDIDPELLQRIRLYTSKDKTAYMFDNMRKVNGRLDESNPFAYAVMLQNPDLSQSEKNIIVNACKNIFELEYEEVEKIKRKYIQNDESNIY